ncbi:hypothetical protein NDS46_30970 (plasmid) [Paenibacillus thiaminolyticus]|uniref:hypothetical protein n=1 Tax=Paenibacillus thiaminolyticus TaxID=49283 RepID=UPI00232FAF52|nr:hypothetical protein [Paenibacillus thiaminolyticus]WCF11383.1 hypothetical protein NDS46_30970 [Paenibacillus thiaminolyticus]
MHDVPRILFTEILNSISEQMKSAIIKHLFDDMENAELHLEEYIKNLVSATFFSDDVIDSSAIKESYHRKKQLTKKNWFNALKKDIVEGKTNPVFEEKEMLEKLLSKRQNIKNIKEIFSTDNPEEFIQIRLNEIEAWVKDPTTYIFDFMYLESKKKFQLQKAIDVDIVCISVNFIQDGNWIISRPNLLVDHSSTFDTSKVTLKGNLMIDRESKKAVLYDEYRMSNDKIILSILQPDPNDEIILDKMVTLDEKDSTIIQTVLNNRGERFYKEKKVVVDLRDIVRETYNSSSSKSYDLVKKRLQKIGRFSIEGRIFNDNKEMYREFLFNFFQFVDIIKDPASGKVFAEITFSDALHEQFINNQTVSIYRHLISKLNNPVSRLLVYAFQKERIEAYVQNRSLKKMFDYNYFHDRIRFRSKRIESNLKSIEASLKEFKELNVLISDYSRVGNAFELSLHPLTSDEVADFFTKSKIQSIEGA